MGSAGRPTGKASLARRPIKPVRADWTDVVLVCRKCSKKLDGGFGEHGKDRLAKALRRELREAAPGADPRKPKIRRLRTAVVEVNCLDVCPKGAVVTVRAGRPGSWLAVPAGTPISDVLDGLGLSPVLVTVH